MPITGLIRPHAHGHLEPRRAPQSLMDKINSQRGAHLKHKARRHTDGESPYMVLGRSAGVSGAAFVVGWAQGHFGTSKIKGVPAELIAAGLLHGAAAFADLPPTAKVAVRALGDGALAAAALTLGYQFGLPNKAAVPAAAPKPGVQGSEPATGGSRLSDEELASFANRTA